MGSTTFLHLMQRLQGGRNWDVLKKKEKKKSSQQQFIYFLLLFFFYHPSNPISSWEGASDKNKYGGQSPSE